MRARSAGNSSCQTGSNDASASRRSFSSIFQILGPEQVGRFRSEGPREEGEEAGPRTALSPRRERKRDTSLNREFRAKSAHPGVFSTGVLARWEQTLPSRSVKRKSTINSARDLRVSTGSSTIRGRTAVLGATLAHGYTDMRCFGSGSVRPSSFPPVSSRSRSGAAGGRRSYEETRPFHGGVQCDTGISSS